MFTSDATIQLSLSLTKRGGGGGGGTKSMILCLLTCKIFQWARSQNIVLCAAHIPRKRNVLGDKLSRGPSIIRLKEWSLNQDIVRHIFQAFNPLNIDLFATWVNRKLQVHCSPFPIHSSEETHKAPPTLVTRCHVPHGTSALKFSR